MISLYKTLGSAFRGRVRVGRGEDAGFGTGLVQLAIAIDLSPKFRIVKDTVSAALSMSTNALLLLFRVVLTSSVLTWMNRLMRPCCLAESHKDTKTERKKKRYKERKTKEFRDDKNNVADG